MASQAAFTAIFSAQDKISGAFNQMADSGNSFMGTLAKIGGVAAGVFSAKAVWDFTKDSIKAFGDFEQGLNEVMTLLPNSTQETFDKMSGQVKKLSSDIGILPDKVVPALYQAISSSVPEDNVFSFLETAGKASIGGITSIETAVDGLTTVINSYGAKNMDVQRASDLMFTTVRLGKTNFEQLSQSLFNVLPSASAAGVSFEEVSASIAALTAQGVPTSVATTKIRAAIDELSKSGTKTDKVFREIAGKGFKDFIKGGGNIQEALQMLEKHAQKSNLGINDLFGSVEAGSAALALTGEGTEAFTNALNEMKNSAGATEAAYEKMDKGFNRTMERIKSKAAVVMLDVGDALAPAVEVIANAVLNGITFIQEGFEKLGPIFSMVVSAFQGLGETIYYIMNGWEFGDAMQPFIDLTNDILYKFLPADVADQINEKIWSLGEDIYNNFGEILVGLPDYLSEANNNIQEAFSGLAEPIMGVLAPIGQVLLDMFGTLASIFMNNLIPAIDLVVLYVQGFTQIWQTVLEVLGPILEVLGSMFSATFTALGELITNVFMPIATSLAEAFATYIAPAISQVVEVIGNILMPILQGLADWWNNTLLPMFLSFAESVVPYIQSAIESFGMIFQGLVDMLTPILYALGAVFNAVWPMIAAAVNGAVQNISNILQALMQTLSGIIAFIAGVFTGNWSKAWEGVKNIFGGVFNGMLALAKGPINGIISLINGLIGALNTIKIPDWVPIIGGKGINIPQIPMLAEGTDFFTDKAAMVGEAGPELVMGPTFSKMPRGSQVLPADKTQDLLRQSGAGSDDGSKVMNINNSFNFTVQAEDGTISESELMRVYRFIVEMLNQEMFEGGDLDLA